MVPWCQPSPALGGEISLQEGGRNRGKRRRTKSVSKTRRRIFRSTILGSRGENKGEGGIRVGAGTEQSRNMSKKLKCWSISTSMNSEPRESGQKQGHEKYRAITSKRTLPSQKSLREKLNASIALIVLLGT